MEVLEFFIILSLIGNFFLGFFVFLKDRVKKINQLFAISCFIASIWIFANLMMGIKKNYFYLRTASAFGVLLPASAIFWVLELCEKEISKNKKYLIWILALLLFIISYVNGLITTNIKEIYLGGFEGETGLFFPLYFIYIGGILIFIVYTLVSEYLKTTGIKKLQIGYVLIGAIFYIGITLVVSFVLPFFGIFKFTALDSPSSLFLIFFTSLAITKYHLFGIRVILTEILVAAMGILLLINVFISKTTFDFIWKGIIFLLFIIFARYLLKATHEEERRREEAERLAIRERALRKETEKLKEDAEKMAREREKLAKEWQRLAKAKDQFIVSIQHHLRTPLTAIREYLSMILGGTYGTLSEKLKRG